MKSFLPLLCLCSLAMAELCIDNKAPRFEPKNKPLGCYVHNKTMPDTLNGLSSLSRPGFNFSDPYMVNRDNILMDDGLCVAHCADYLFTFAALRQGEECRCGNSDGLNSYIQVPDSQCNTTCVGDSASECGGQNAYTVYGNVVAELPEIKVSKIGIEEKVTVLRDLDHEKLYKGCIPDSLICHRETLMQETFDMTVETCIEFCDGHGFPNAGLESGTRCICMKSFASTSLLHPEECSTSCAGNSSVICGGPVSISVYAVDTQSGLHPGSPLKPLISTIITAVIVLIAAIIILHRSRKRLARYWARLRGKTSPEDVILSYSVNAKDLDAETTQITDSTTHLTTSHANSDDVVKIDSPTKNNSAYNLT
ncbi:6912_t:CDS:1 [Paraglomus occultum]|uniref:6912_t:CDS:1 n=1 Tax=Paraglomus occultum TaxID=144539 RepID=A0A9N8ZW02_9GLOM|nr:6912_t:CDS:1 [Paraglomus occultum]